MLFSASDIIKMFVLTVIHTYGGIGLGKNIYMSNARVCLYFLLNLII